MKILVFGAGVLGSLYAAKFQESGHDVTVLARGERLKQIQENGIRLQEQGSEQITATPVKVIDHLEADEQYDWILVIVRRNQLAGALEMLRVNRASPNVLFMVNNAGGWADLVDAMGSKRVLLGFAGAGGKREQGVVTYLKVERGGQPTTVGEIDGHISARVRQICDALEGAGFPAAISLNMDAWLKTHAVLVSPVANAVYMAGGSTYRLAETRDALVLMVRAVREGLSALATLGIPITPRKYEIVRWLPEPLLVAVLRKSLASERAELALARHANAARDEMLLLADEVRALIAQAGQSAPAYETLYRYLDTSVQPAAQGAQTLPLDWKPLITTGLALWVGFRLLRGLRRCCRGGKHS